MILRESTRRTNKILQNKQDFCFFMNLMSRKLRKRVKRINPFLSLLLFLEFIFPPHVVLASQSPAPQPQEPVIEVAGAGADNQMNKFIPEIKFPQAVERKIIKIFSVSATAYSSARAQTDASPFVSASGVRVFDGMVAANFLPFGAKVRLPDLYGNKQFVVLDRMHPRFSHRIDVWMDSYDKAKQFGVKYARVEVIE